MTNAQNYNSILNNGVAGYGYLTVAPRELALANGGASVTGISKTYDGNAVISNTPVSVATAAGHDVLLGDQLAYVANGAFTGVNAADVGVAKSASVALTLTGANAANYKLPIAATNGTLAVTGDVIQLQSVTWVGGSSGNWFEANNWAGGALPVRANVANVIIPTGATVLFNHDVAGSPTLDAATTITNNGALAFGSVNPYTLNSSINGLGKIVQSGTGALTLASNNTSSGGVDLNNATLILDNATAVGSGVLRSNAGSLRVNPVVNQLAVEGSVTLLSDVVANGNLSFTGSVSLASANTVTANNVAYRDQLIKSVNGDVLLNAAVDSGVSAKSANRRLTVQSNGMVVIGDTIGTAAPVVSTDPQTGEVTRIAYSTYATQLNRNLYSILVQAPDIYIKGDVITFNNQVYESLPGAVDQANVWIGDNGKLATDPLWNGYNRLLLSMDPNILINARVNDTSVDVTGVTKHRLTVAAMSMNPNSNNLSDNPEIAILGKVGDVSKLRALDLITGVQDTAGAVTQVLRELVSPSNTFAAKVRIGGDVSTLGAQNYYGTNFTLGDPNAAMPVAITLLANVGENVSFISPDISNGVSSANSLQMNAPGGLIVQDATLVTSSTMGNVNVTSTRSIPISSGSVGGSLSLDGVAPVTSVQLPSNVNVPNTVRYDTLAMRHPDLKLTDVGSMGLTGNVDVGAIKVLEECLDMSETSDCKIK